MKVKIPGNFLIMSGLFQQMNTITSKFFQSMIYLMQNLDDVLVPPDHVSRSYNDTYLLTLGQS